MKWEIGNVQSTVVDKNQHSCLDDFYPQTKEAEKYYGGFLIAESIPKREYVNLISAAPEMLEALKMALEKAERNIAFWNTDLQLMREAIAKAEGRT